MLNIDRYLNGRTICYDVRSYNLIFVSGIITDRGCLLTEFVHAQFNYSILYHLAHALLDPTDDILLPITNTFFIG